MDEDLTAAHRAPDPERVDATRAIDKACDRYEAALASEGLTPFAGYLDVVDSADRPRLLRELVALACEWLGGQGVEPVEPVLRAANPHLADEVAAAIPRTDGAHGTAAFLGPRPGRGLTPRRKRSRGLRLRCPHCSNHVELVGDTPLDVIDCTTCGSRFSLVDRSRETAAAQALQRIDRFELLSRLGVGGFGTVWKARDTELQRAVALKIPRHGQLTESEIEQFLREARAAAQLSHPNIVPVHEVGREGDTVFIVSDLVRGVSLADLLTGERPTIRDAAEICRKIAEALQHAHDHGVIHRDLKPSNVMIDDDGGPHLMDFGLAKREAEEVTMTTDGQIVGTPAYMSPEQAGGRSAWADRRTDVYSLGVILFEMVTGELPFRGNAQMQVRQRLVDDAPSARKLNSLVPLDLATICAKCLEREPGRRYASAAAAADDLQRFLERRPIAARPLSAVGRASRWGARHPAWAALLGLLLALSIVGPAVAIVINQQRVRLAQLVTEKDDLIERRVAEADASERDRERLRRRLDVWEGRANPWDLWPPKASESPRQSLLASVLRERGEGLRVDGSEAPDIEVAKGRLALAILHESVGDVDAAVSSLGVAIAALDRLGARQPRSAPVASALADAHERLSRLLATSDPTASSESLNRALAERRRIAAEHPEAAKLQADRLATELHSAVAAGYENASEQLNEASRLGDRLSALWPRAVDDLYRLACQLAGDPAALADFDPEASGSSE